MNSKKVIFTYFLLILLLMSSAAIFAYEIKFFMRERVKDPLEPYKGRIVDPETVKKDTDNKNKLALQSIIDSVGKPQAFIALATPVPRPTPTIRPEPSPTPFTPAKGYTLMMATANIATIKSYKGISSYVRVGETVKEDLGDFQIMEISPDRQNPRVKVKDIRTGSVGFLTKEGNKVTQ